MVNHLSPVVIAMTLLSLSFREPLLANGASHLFLQIFETKVWNDISKNYCKEHLFTFRFQIKSPHRKSKPFLRKCQHLKENRYSKSDACISDNNLFSFS